MVNTANAEGRVYRAERSHGKKNRRKFSADRIALALGFMVLYSGVVIALADK